MGFQDLPPRKDPKGGSPKTPYPPPSFSAPVEPEGNYIYPNGAMLWRAIATGLGGLLVGMTVAWFTAFQYRGLSQKDAEELIQRSQYEQEKHLTPRSEIIELINTSQSEQEKHLLSRLEMHEYVKEYSPWSFDKQAIITRMAAQDQTIGELRTKIDLAAKLIDTQKR